MKNYIGLLLAFLLSACSNTQEPANESTGFLTDKMKNLISTTETIPMKGEQIIRLNGKVSASADARIEIPAMVSGRVKKVHVRQGDTVNKGDLLAILSSNELTALQAELVAAQSDLDRERKEFEAAQGLFNDGLLSNKELAAAKGELEIARSEVKRVEKQLSILGSNGNSEYHITSPISGIVESRSIHANSYLSGDYEEPMFTITNLDQVMVSLLISESNIRFIKEGLEVKMRSLSYPDKLFEGKINRVVRVLDPESKVMKANVVINNENHMLLPEMFVQSEVTIKSEDSLIAVPSSAVIFDEGQNYVVCSSGDGHYQNKRVEIWGRKDNKTFISKGLEANQKVVSQYPLLIFTEIHNNEKYGN